MGSGFGCRVRFRMRLRIKVKYEVKVRGTLAVDRGGALHLLGLEPLGSALLLLLLLERQLARHSALRKTLPQRKNDADKRVVVFDVNKRHLLVLGADLERLLLNLNVDFSEVERVRVRATVDLSR